MRFEGVDILVYSSLSMKVRIRRQHQDLEQLYKGKGDNKIESSR